MKTRKACSPSCSHRPVNPEYLPAGTTLWLVFDLTNGHRGAHRYTWWFDTKKDAMEHIKWQRSLEASAPLSKPFRVVLQGAVSFYQGVK